ncbi:MAG: hypothetical protein ACFFC7_22380 [Candidatus Hermodarchaeota archaeon]
MLKELFLIGHGIPFFYYSSDKMEADLDNVVLSSGLLSAIKDFSESVREDTISHFLTEKEYFLFVKCCDAEKTIVGVFDRGVSERLAKEALSKIQDLITQTSIVKEITPKVDTPEREVLKEKISLVVSQLFAAEGEADFIEQLLQQRSNIPLAFLVDIDQRKSIAHFARPKPLFRPEQVREFLLLFSTLIRSLSKLGLPETYSYFVIRSREYVTASCLTGEIASVATGALQSSTEEVLDAAIKMRHYSSINDFVSFSIEGSLMNRSSLLSNGNLIHEEGEPLSTISGVFLSTLINNVNGFFKLLSRRNFDEFEVIVGKETKKSLVIHRKESSNDFIVELFQYS